MISERGDCTLNDKTLRFFVQPLGQGPLGLQALKGVDCSRRIHEIDQNDGMHDERVGL
jgi:hypothetical protein